MRPNGLAVLKLFGAIVLAGFTAIAIRSTNATFVYAGF